jgi:hypothetical protein
MTMTATIPDRNDLPGTAASDPRRVHDARATFPGLPAPAAGLAGDATDPDRDGRRRLSRLAALGPDRLTAALSFLAGYDPLVFDAALDATEPCADDGRHDAEPPAPGTFYHRPAHGRRRRLVSPDDAV